MLHEDQRRKGDPVTDQDEAYERLIRPIEDRMIRSVWRIIRNADDVDDAFQDALARIWRQWRRIQRHANPEALILRICINAAYDSLRRKARESEDGGAVNLSKISTLVPRGARLTRLPADERKASLCAAISRLPKNEGLAIHLRYIEEQPYEEIARALACRTRFGSEARVAGLSEKLQGILPRVDRRKLRKNEECEIP